MPRWSRFNIASVVLGFGTLAEPSIRRSVAVLAELVERLLRRSNGG